MRLLSVWGDSTMLLLIEIMERALHIAQLHRAQQWKCMLPAAAMVVTVVVLRVRQQWDHSLQATATALPAVGVRQHWEPLQSATVAAAVAVGVRQQQ